jgi:hypothetical protein
LTRNHTYENEGRFQNENEALLVRTQIMNMLEVYDIDYNIATSSEKDCERIVNDIVKEIRENE